MAEETLLVLGMAKVTGHILQSLKLERSSNAT